MSFQIKNSATGGRGTTKGNPSARGLAQGYFSFLLCNLAASQRGIEAKLNRNSKFPADSFAGNFSYKIKLGAMNIFGRTDYGYFRNIR